MKQTIVPPNQSTRVRRTSHCLTHPANAGCERYTGPSKPRWTARFHKRFTFTLLAVWLVSSWGSSVYGILLVWVWHFEKNKSRCLHLEVVQRNLTTIFKTARLQDREKVSFVLLKFIILLFKNALRSTACGTVAVQLFRPACLFDVCMY